MATQLNVIRDKFIEMDLTEKGIEKAMANLKLWMSNKLFSDYLPQINYLIESGQFSELYDCFYQTIPFGTGGRRGKVGVGPNRINPMTIASSAQGHSQYLVQKNGEDCKDRGIVIIYDVRQFNDFEGVYNSEIPNPVLGITSQELARIAASIYAENGFKIFFYPEVRSTPQLSFTIRHLNAVSGINISASHNPVDNNGKKVFDENGGQLIPPYDQELADEVNNKVDVFDIHWNEFQSYVDEGLIELLDEKVDKEYQNTVMKLSRSNNRSIRILFSPLHGTGITNIYPVLKNLGFDVHLETESAKLSGKFPTVPDQIANPELPVVYERLYSYADQIDADIVLTSDPDADRVGVSARTSSGNWQYIDGNHLVILTYYYLMEKLKDDGELSKDKIFLASKPVTSLVKKMGDDYGVTVENQLIPGFKYFGDRLNQLEKEGRIDDFVFGAEDTVGHLAGNYARDKDGSVCAIFISELAGELKEKGSDLTVKLDELFQKYGYFINITEYILLKHSFERYKILAAMDYLRENKEKSFPGIEVDKYIDNWEEGEIVSDTDRSSRNLIEFVLASNKDYQSAKIMVRPSGTEPKIKMYIEVEKNEELDDLNFVKFEAEKVKDLLWEKMEKVIREQMEKAKP